MSRPVKAHKGSGEPYYTVLTMMQPWASLVVMGHKKYETRSWQTRYRGELLIHAAARITADAIQLASQPPFSKYIPDIMQLPTAAIIGTVGLRNIYTTAFIESMMTRLSNRTQAHEEWQFGNYEAGRYAWELVRPEQFERPIPLRGSLGLWRIPKMRFESLHNSHQY